MAGEDIFPNNDPSHINRGHRGREKKNILFCCVVFGNPRCNLWTPSLFFTLAQEVTGRKAHSEERLVNSWLSNTSGMFREDKMVCGRDGSVKYEMYSAPF